MAYYVSPAIRRDFAPTLTMFGRGSTLPLVNNSKIYSGCRITAIMSGFQPEDVGSTPITRCKFLKQHSRDPRNKMAVPFRRGSSLRDKPRRSRTTWQAEDDGFPKGSRLPRSGTSGQFRSPAPKNYWPGIIPDL